MAHAPNAGHAGAAVPARPPVVPVQPSSPLAERARQAALADRAARSAGHFHPMPVVGYPAAYYDKHIQQAQASGDPHAVAAYTVGRAVTAATAPSLSWPEKLGKYCDCLARHCAAPPGADADLQAFYGKLADMVRRHAGQEALHAARHHHQEYQRRLRAGEPRAAIEDDAEIYFFGLLGHAQCPDWCSREAWNQITEWRDFWV